jgi:hypothetical protein
VGWVTRSFGRASTRRAVRCGASERAEANESEERAGENGEALGPAHRLSGHGKRTVKSATKQASTAASQSARARTGRSEGARVTASRQLVMAPSSDENTSQTGAWPRVRAVKGADGAHDGAVEDAGEGIGEAGFHGRADEPGESDAAAGDAAAHPRQCRLQPPPAPTATRILPSRRWGAANPETPNAPVGRGSSSQPTRVLAITSSRIFSPTPGSSGSG